MGNMLVVVALSAVSGAVRDYWRASTRYKRPLTAPRDPAACRRLAHLLGSGAMLYAVTGDETPTPAFPRAAQAVSESASAVAVRPCFARGARPVA